MPTGAQILHRLRIDFTQRGEGRERGASEKLKYCALCYWILYLIFYIFFSKLLQAGGSRRVELPWASTKTCGQLRKRDCSGIYLRIKFIISAWMWSEKEKAYKLLNPKLSFNKNIRTLNADISERSQKPLNFFILPMLFFLFKSKWRN